LIHSNFTFDPFIFIFPCGLESKSELRGADEGNNTEEIGIGGGDGEAARCGEEEEEETEDCKKAGLRASGAAVVVKGTFCKTGV
jgi:hypothetical protein